MDVPVYAISDAIFRLFCGLPIFEERTSHVPYQWTEEEKTELCGEYISGEGDQFVLKKNPAGLLDMIVNGSPVELTPVYPWQGMVRKKYTDVYLTAVRDEEGKVFAAHYGSRIFPKTSA